MADMDEIPWAKFRKHEKRIRAMLEDPDMTDELLLVGLALARWADGIRSFERDDKKGYSWNDILEGFIGKKAYHRSAWDSVARTIRDDIPRYQMEYGWARPCSAPMIRREGECGKSGSNSRYYTDPNTGEKFVRHACSRHKDWLERDWRMYTAQYPPKDAPTPAQNTGGVLEKHFPQINWEEIYVALDPNWKRPPTAAPQPKPTLRLVVDNAQENA